MSATKDDITISYDVQITIAFYVIVLLFGLATNIILTYLLFTRKFMKTKYIFTANISVSHIIVCVVVIPLAISYFATNNVNVRHVCDVIVCLSIGLTSQSIVATSVRRALALSERFRHATFTYRGKIKHIACIWVFSISVAIPYGFNRNSTNAFSIFPPNLLTHLETNENTSLIESTKTGNGILNVTSTITSNVTYRLKSSNLSTDNISTNVGRGDNFPEFHFYVYDVILLFLQMILPTIVSLILHAVTLRAIKRRPNQTHWVKEIMITKQHIASVVVFFICWFPSMVANVLYLRVEVKELVYRILHPIAVGAIVYFPLIYYKLNSHINREFNIWFQNVFCRTAEANV